MTRDSFVRPLARGLVAAGVAVPLAVLLVRLPVLAVDIDLSLRWTLAVLAATCWLGARWAKGNVINGAAAANSTGALSIWAVVAGACWVALANTGATWAVLALVVVGTATSCAALAAAFGDAIPAHRSLAATLIGGYGSMAAVGGFAVAATAAALAWHPPFRWDTATTVAGVAAIIGGLLRTRCADTVDARPAPKPGPRQAEAGAAIERPVRWAAVASFGMVPTAVAAIAGRFGTGERYAWLVLLGGALGTVAVAGAGHLFHRADREPARYRGEIAAVAAAVAGLAALAASASVTLVGAVGGWALALAAATTCVVNGASVVDLATAESRARHLAVVFQQTWRGTAIGLAFTAAADHLLTWRQIGMLAAVPALVVGARTALTLFELPPAATLGSSTVSLTRAQRARPASSPLLDVRGVCVSYGPVQTLFGVNLHVDAGEAVALVGTNGAGKTTLLRTIAGLTTTTAGSITFGGVDLGGFDARGRSELGVSLVAHGSAIAERLTVHENLEMFGFAVPHSAYRAGKAQALELFPRLGERLHQPATTLSGGEKQMLALAKLLIAQPRLVVIDEFSLGLAPIVVGQLLPVVRSIHERGAAVLIVEQSLNIALSLADRAYVMEKGEIVYEGDTDTLRSQPDLLRAVYLEGISHALATTQPTAATGEASA